METSSISSTSELIRTADSLNVTTDLRSLKFWGGRVATRVTQTSPRAILMRWGLRTSPLSDLQVGPPFGAAGRGRCPSDDVEEVSTRGHAASPGPQHRTWELICWSEAQDGGRRQSCSHTAASRSTLQTPGDPGHPPPGPAQSHTLPVKEVVLIRPL